MAKSIMVQGTMSGAGKSLIVTALCRIFRQDGYNVAPFKSQNMALNSYITADGLEMGRAQVAQAEAAGKDPDVRMNPILLKPSSDVGSQLIVNGEVRGNYSAVDYYAMKKTLIPEVMEAYNSLAAENDIIVIEGAGSPAEINLKEDDLVNMGMAKMAGSPVILVGDIDRGGVFAQLYGTIELLPQDEQDLIIGTLINKFRGDVSILEPGLIQLEEKTGKPVLGVVPYAHVDIDDEDSLAPRLEVKKVHRPLDVAVIRLPHISNFTDFSPLTAHPSIGVRYVGRTEELGVPDLLILPGTKNTMDDLLWLRQNGLENRIMQLHEANVPILGICGGYQMLGEELSDPDGVEHGGTLRGMGLLPCRTVFAGNKTRTRKEAEVLAEDFAGARVQGYEIHMGVTDTGDAAPFCSFTDGRTDGAAKDDVFGTYLHGLFDTGEMTARLAKYLAARKGIEVEDLKDLSHEAYKETQYDILADAVRENIDLEAVYRAMGIGGEV